jgi:hypothetical protein
MKWMTVLAMTFAGCAAVGQQQESHQFDFLKALEPQQRTADAIYRSQQLAIERGYLDLAREREQRLAWEQKESARLQERVLDTNFGYTDFRRGVANWRLNQDVKDAFAFGRKQHADFDELLPAMRIVSDGVRPNWGKITMSEYMECLYSIAKTARFTAVK